MSCHSQAIEPPHLDAAVGKIIVVIVEVAVAPDRTYGDGGSVRDEDRKESSDLGHVHD